MRNFLAYIKRYFTHYTIIQIAKNNGMLEKDKWYSIHYYIKLSDKPTQLYIDDIRIIEVKDKK